MAEKPKLQLVRIAPNVEPPEEYWAQELPEDNQELGWSNRKLKSRRSLAVVQLELAELQIAEINARIKRAEQQQGEPAQRWPIETLPEQQAHAERSSYWDDWHRVDCAFPRVPEDGCFMLLSGAKASNKSGVLLKECLDASLNKGARVLYLATEGAHGIITKRLPVYLEERGKKVGDIEKHWRVLRSAPNLLNNADVDAFCRHVLRAWGKPDLVPIDTITKAFGGGQINQPQVGAGIVMGAERMAQAFGGATVIGVSHPPAGKKGPNARAMGSSQQENLAYGVLRVELKPERMVELYVAHMKEGPAEFTISYRVLGGGVGSPPPVLVDAEQSTVAPPGDVAAVLTMLRGAPEGMSKGALDDALSWLPGRTSRALTKAQTDGLIVKGDGWRGLWRVKS